MIGLWVTGYHRRTARLTPGCQIRGSSTRTGANPERLLLRAERGLISVPRTTEENTGSFSSTNKCLGRGTTGLVLLVALEEKIDVNEKCFHPGDDQ